MPLHAETRSELIKLAPYGLVATKAWLVKQGLTRHSIDNLVKARQLIPLCSGVYQRPETNLTWQGVVFSMQRIGLDLSVGGLMALEMQGFAHYLPLSKTRTIDLYGHDKLPAWANKLLPEVKFVRHSQASHLTEFDLEIRWGDSEWPLTISTPEKAFLEVLRSVPEQISFEHADQLMQGMTSLSPHRLDRLLERTKSIKVVRLFFWFADRHQHQWRKKLEANDYRLGSGKRVLAVGGKLDKKYLITVPDLMHE